MRLGHFDLNLFVTLDALLETRSITRASERLNIGASTTATSTWRSTRRATPAPTTRRTRCSTNATCAWCGRASTSRATSWASMASRHVAAQFGDLRVPTFESRFFAAHGVERNIVVVASSFNALPPLVVGTQRIATVHARLARMYSRVLPVRVLEPPFAIPPLELVMQWNRHNDKDAAHAWMCRRLKAVATEMV